MTKLLGIGGAFLAFIAAFIPLLLNDFFSISYFDVLNEGEFSGAIICFAAAGVGLVGALINKTSWLLWAGVMAIAQAGYSLFLYMSEDTTGVSLGAAIFVLAIGGILMIVGTRVNQTT